MGNSILFCYICPVLAKVVPHSKQNPKLNQSARMERSKKQIVRVNPAKVIFIRISPISKGWAVACSVSIFCILTEWVKEGPRSLKQQPAADIPGRTCNWFFNILDCSPMTPFGKVMAWHSFQETQKTGAKVPN